MDSSSSGGSNRWSSRENKTDCALSFAVQGTAAPRAARPPRQRRKPVQPPNSPARPSLLPVDRVNSLKSELNKCFEEGCDFSSRPSSAASSHPDLALDLSSVADSCRETDRSTTASSCDESEWSEGWTKKLTLPTSYASSRTYSVRGSPLSAILKKEGAYKPCGRVPRLSISSSSPPQTNVCKISERTEDSCDKSSKRSSTRSHNDLIGLYVDTVNNNELSKYFRPCINCEEVCCQCPPSPLRLDLCTICGRKQCECQVQLDCEKCGYEIITEKKVQHKQQTSKPAQESQRSLPEMVTSDEDRNSMVSRYLLERRFFPAVNSPQGRTLEHNGDSGNSTLQLDDSGRDAGPASILSRQHVSLSVMQLATAAQCARILADSLESVLELAKEELTGTGRPSLLSGTDTTKFNQKSLMSAFANLNNSDPRTQTQIEENLDKQ